MKKVGGFSYFLSLLSLFVLSLFNLAALLSVMPKIISEHALELIIFAISITVGFFGALLLVPEPLLVFMHETKHALVSGLAGNKWKRMKVDSYSGHFEYAYSKKTAHYNAMISLAPYFVPLVTIPCLLLAYAVFYPNHRLMIGLVGFGWGVDLFSNIKDIDPRQSDFSELRGGFRLALLYVTFANCFIVSLLTAWAIFGGAGLKLLVFFVFDSLRSLSYTH